MIKPLKTILSASRYPFAVAFVKDGAITHTVGYASSLEDCYFQVQGWRSWMNTLRYPEDGNYIMAEMKEIGEAIPDVCVNTYWVPV